MGRLFHGAKQNIFSAGSNLPPGAIPATGLYVKNVSKAPATEGVEALQGPSGDVTPKFAAATMHNDLADNARQLAQGDKNVPVHPAFEGSDKQGYGGDASSHDPTGVGRGV